MIIQWQVVKNKNKSNKEDKYIKDDEYIYIYITNNPCCYWNHNKENQRFFMDFCNGCSGLFF